MFKSFVALLAAAVPALTCAENLPVLPEAGYQIELSEPVTQSSVSTSPCLPISATCVYSSATFSAPVLNEYAITAIITSSEALSREFLLTAQGTLTTGPVSSQRLTDSIVFNTMAAKDTATGQVYAFQQGLDSFLGGSLSVDLRGFSTQSITVTFTTAFQPGSSLAVPNDPNCTSLSCLVTVFDTATFTRFTARSPVVSSIPEPQITGLTLAGLALIGLARRGLRAPSR